MIGNSTTIMPFGGFVYLNSEVTDPCGLQLLSNAILHTSGCLAYLE